MKNVKYAKISTLDIKSEWDGNGNILECYAQELTERKEFEEEGWGYDNALCNTFNKKPEIGDYVISLNTPMGETKLIKNREEAIEYFCEIYGYQWDIETEDIDLQLALKNCRNSGDFNIMRLK